MASTTDSTVVRFPPPFRRGRAAGAPQLLDVSEGEGFVQLKVEVTIEIEGKEPSGVRGGDAEPGVLL